VYELLQHKFFARELREEGVGRGVWGEVRQCGIQAE
jgi:hypothetical protein